MTIANRVQPDGEFLATPARGLLMGNRGVLHDDHGVIGPARWKHRNWVCCALSFRGRHRKLLQPRTWTELFFLDEAVALAAGHRPCGECRHRDHQRFRQAWAKAFGAPAPAAAMDDVLHPARALPGARHLRHEPAQAADLPDGTFVRDRGGHCLLLFGDMALPYAPQGYGPPLPRPTGEVTALTSAPMRAVLAAGYLPILHPSAAQPAP